jgi:energy-coupling factor transporter transmembrane protein EcfT
LNTEKQGYLHKLYPFTKLYFIGLVIVASLIAPHYAYLYGIFIITCMLALTGTEFKTFIKTVLKTLGLIIVLIFLLQAFFRPGTHVLLKFWIFGVKWEGILFALKLNGILLDIASSFILFFQTTRIQDLTLALEKAGSPSVVSYVVLSTLQMIPQMKKRSEVIMNAQQARGIETKGSLKIRARAFFPMLGPLILSSFSSTEERALTLEARGFSAPVKKSHLHDITDTRTDRTIRIILVILLLLAAGGRILLWLL